MKKWMRIVFLTAGFFFFTAFNRDKPQILIIGDSISIGYFPYVKSRLSGTATVVHNTGNAQSTYNGLKKIHGWLGERDWDVIQFNWGLWDMAYRKSEHAGKRKLTTTLEDYGKNLETLVGILKTTQAKLVFVTTTYVPENSPGRLVKDPERYNKVAVEIMKKNGVLVNDIYQASKRIHKKDGKSDNNVHYTKKGYEELSRYIVSFLKNNVSL